MLNQLRYAAFILLFLLCSPLHGLIDNRFLVPPLYEYKPFIFPESHHHLNTQPYVMTANKSFPRCEEDGDESLPLFEINGPYNQLTIDKALQASGRTSMSLLRSDLVGSTGSIPWFMPGRLDVYGFAFNYYYRAHNHFGFGASFAFMHANSRIEIMRDREHIKNAIIGPGDERELFLAKQEMNKALGVGPALWIKNALSDLDIFLHICRVENYRYKFRRIDAGMKLGFLVPTAPRRNFNNPASISLGGDGHWGFYVDLDADLELKEDVNAGGFFRIIKRLPRTQCHRMPALTEPTIFGAIVGNAEVDPGITYAFCPYFSIEGVQHGLGFRFAYTLTAHEEDEWTDKRNNRSTPVNLPLLEERSEWASEFVTLGLFYDFAKDLEYRGPVPLVSLTWDIPVHGIISKNSFKTQGVSLIIETDF